MQRRIARCVNFVRRLEGTEKSTRREFLRRLVLHRKKNFDAVRREIEIRTYVSRSTRSPPEATTVSRYFPSEAAAIAKDIPFGVLRMRSENRMTFRCYLIIERNLPISGISLPWTDL
ncbi:hypothetical protein ACS0PU_000938 [Formica fusca]